MVALHVSSRVLRTVLALGGIFCGVGGAQLVAAAGAWQPAGPVRLIVPYPPGGGTDVAARLMSTAVGDTLGQPLVVENRPGANGVIGANLSFAAKPDGLTLFFATSDVVSTMPHVQPDVIRFKPEEFRSVAPVGRGGYVLVSPLAKAKGSFQEVLADLRSGNTQLNYGHWGPGSMSQMAMEQFKLAAGVPALQAIPYKGSADVMNAVVAGQVDYAFIPPSLADASRSRLKMYAVSSVERVPLLPDLPTLRELGFDVNAETLYGVLAPPGTPQPAIDFLYDKITAATKNA
ncbi:Bug family tripartite tricarboxylate transporter substrate binding protein, partial [Bordetella pseudohinzii]